MYNIFKILKDINETYVLINNIEAGSLPEVYHFHIFTNNFLLNFNDIEKEFIDKDKDFYEIKAHKIYANMYIIINIDEDKINFIFKLINNIRNSLIDNYLYIPQLYFLLINDNGKKYDSLIISFKKINYNNIEIKNDNLKKEYYNELFLDKEHSIYYYPYGIIHLAKNIESFILDDDLINKIKSYYILIPNIINYLNIDINNNNIIIKNNIGFSYYLNQLLLQTLDIKFNKFNNTIETDNRTYILPILYKIHDIKINEYIYENGIIDFSQSLYYYIKVESINYIHFNNFIYELYKKFNNINNILPYYYCNIKINNNYYYIFENIKTTLDIFLELDIKNLKNDNNLVDYFMLKILVIC
jgi:hypothetical protein